MSKQLLIVVDVQNDFVEGGALPYGYPTERNTQKVVDFACNWVKESDIDNTTHILVTTKDTHGADYSSTLEGKNLPVPHCIKGTNGWQYVSDSPFGIDWCTYKEFYKTTFGTFRIKEWIKEFETKPPATGRQCPPR